MTKTQYINAAVSELLSTVSITESALTTSLTRLFDQALEQFSRDCPYMVTETHTDVEEEATITLNSDVYSKYINAYYLDTDTNYRTPIAVLNLELSTNTVLFYHPLYYDTITVEYYIKHTVDTSSSTIPQIYEYAFLYLLCAYEMQYELYGTTSNIKSVDNGILKIVMGDVDSTTSRQSMDSYIDRYFQMIRINNTEAITENPDNYLIDDSTDFGW